ncbi:hypothetical protein [Methanochimaera problematica]|nr:hypothetical protein [Methanoplanus sp. FWC-SCC4]
MWLLVIIPVLLIGIALSMYFLGYSDGYIKGKSEGRKELAEFALSIRGD